MQKISEADLPCVNMFIHRDRLIEEGNGLERRQVMIEIEGGFIVKGDAEQELSDLRARIEHAIESSEALMRKVLKLLFMNVEFSHDMAGSQRVAVLTMSARIDYERPYPRPAAQFISPVLSPTINGEKADG
ncbi:hypothetical protein [Oligoflexus tunisiensis]|uniref:hypothetical protein n=1 Tax=Oligoflexus tunisiensis TaxID=708132 RepID=UPI001C404948|nr:hypothetical protein [Oligoflexus tunisiensis]